MARAMASVGVPLAAIIAAMAVWAFLDLRGDVKKLIDVVTADRITAAADHRSLEEHGRRITNLERAVWRAD